MLTRNNIFSLAFITLVTALGSVPVFAGDAPALYGYKVTGTMAQPPDSWVQGLQIVDNHLYVSTGKKGKSRLLRYRMANAELELESAKALDKRFFGEGMTVLNEKIYQLTWKSRIAFIYNKADLKGLEWFRIPGQGWGITNNGVELIYSDGSHILHVLSPETLKISRSITVTENGKALGQLNELEWVDGQIWANVWFSNRIVIIDPVSGIVTGSIDLQGLLPDNELRPLNDILNGIALNPADGSIWVTGKNWPWLYQIELVESP